jgi:hypothetical protein
MKTQILGLSLRNQKDLASAISVAALSINHLSKKHNHQRRQKKSDLTKLKDNLLKRKQDIKYASDFANLLEVVEECKVKEVGDLACYNVANRLRSRLGKYPKFVYIHAGTKKGLENLLGQKVKSRYLNKFDLSEPFKSSTLTCHEIEDILCIYKERLKKSP